MKLKIEKERYQRVCDQDTLKGMVSTADKMWEEGDKHGAILLNIGAILVETNIRLSQLIEVLKK